MLLDADDAQLVLVDYQTRLMPVIFENELVTLVAPIQKPFIERFISSAHRLTVPFTEANSIYLFI